MADYAEGHVIYLDASVILPALANGHPSQSLYRNLLADTSRIGMKLRVSREMLGNETFANIGLPVAHFIVMDVLDSTCEMFFRDTFCCKARGAGTFF